MSPSDPNPDTCEPSATLPPLPRLVVAADHEEMSRRVADRIAAALRQQPDSLVCLATGASPQRTYELLVGDILANPALGTRARWLKLDEWGGLPPDDPATCESYLRRLVLDPLRVPPDRYTGWHSNPDDPAAECRRIAAWLHDHGPIDLLILGVGINGHLGFNEPARHLQPDPHIAELTDTSLGHSMLDSCQGQVRYGLTLGIGDILAARRILVLVSGAHKAAQLRRMLLEPASPEFPASLLQDHPAVTVYCDATAAALLPLQSPADHQPPASPS